MSSFGRLEQCASNIVKFTDFCVSAVPWRTLVEPRWYEEAPQPLNQLRYVDDRKLPSTKSPIAIFQVF